MKLNEKDNNFEPDASVTDSSMDGCRKRQSPSPSAILRVAHVASVCVFSQSHPCEGPSLPCRPPQGRKRKGGESEDSRSVGWSSWTQPGLPTDLPTDQQPLKHPPRSLKSQNPRQSVSQSARAHSIKNNGLTALAPPGCPAARAQAVSTRGLGAGDPRGAGPGEGFQASDDE